MILQPRAKQRLLVGGEFDAVRHLPTKAEPLPASGKSTATKSALSTCSHPNIVLSPQPQAARQGQGQQVLFMRA